MDNQNCNQEEGRWKTYTTYKLIMWAWMMNEASVVFSPVDISHDGFFIHTFIHLTAVIFVGIPLVYSEICIAQYTNCSVITMWNFLPILRGVGYGSFYLIALKTLYAMVLTSWYLEYTFFSARDPPPWFTCDDFNKTKCMIKRANVSVFQHCIEAQSLFDIDCGVQTSSNCFYEREIGNNNTKISNCVHLWKVVIASCTSGLILFILSIKREKFIQTIVKLLAIYVCIVVLILFWVALSSTGTWYARKIVTNWDTFETAKSVNSFTRGMLSCGAGIGVIAFLSRDVSFRSPATMTSVTVPLCSTLVTTLLALILFGGIKTMSYYHGEEENVLEIGEGLFFTVFASVTEILMYFDQQPVWTFIWLSAVFFCLFMNLWILYLFFQETMFNSVVITQKYNKFSSVVLIVIICGLSAPFYCCDLAAVLHDVIHILQLMNVLFFSLAVYWFYGFKNHSVDIIFMIGVKPSIYWKITWILIPIVTFINLLLKWSVTLTREYDNSYFIKSISVRLDMLLLEILISIYFLIIFIALLIQLKNYYFYNDLRNLFFPTPNWGPSNKVLYRSRKMFVPEIMTREFLYRQVRIRGYSKKKSQSQYKESDVTSSTGLQSEDVEWSALTSN